MEGKERTFQAEVSQRMMYVEKPWAAVSMLPECKLQDRACQGTKLQKVAKLFPKDLYALSFLVI